MRRQQGLSRAARRVWLALWTRGDSSREAGAGPGGGLCSVRTQGRVCTCALDARAASRPLGTRAVTGPRRIHGRRFGPQHPKTMSFKTQKTILDSNSQISADRSECPSRGRDSGLLRSTDAPTPPPPGPTISSPTPRVMCLAPEDNNFCKPCPGACDPT